MVFSFQPGKFKPVIEVIVEGDNSIDDPVTMIADPIGKPNDSFNPAASSLSPSCGSLLPKSSLALLRETLRSPNSDDLLVMGSKEAIPARSSDFFACPCFLSRHGTSLPSDVIRSFQHMAMPHGCPTCFWCSAPATEKYLARNKPSTGASEVYKYRDFVKYQLGSVSNVQFTISSPSLGPDPCIVDVDNYALSGLGQFKIWSQHPRIILPWTVVLANGLKNQALRSLGKQQSIVGLNPDRIQSDTSQPLSL